MADSLSAAGTSPERWLQVPDPADRSDLVAFLTRAVRLDEAAVVRLRQRPDGLLSAWVNTGFDALAARVLRGTIAPADTTVAADGLRAALVAAGGDGMDPGWAMDSAWRGALPPDAGYVHLDDVPARVLVDLAQRGVTLSREQGQGPPSSLLAQEVLEVAGGGERAGVPMRLVFALNAMGFVPTGGAPATAEIDLDRIDPAEVVRVRASATWLRLDARYGSVYLRRGGGLGLSVR
ncbi:MULTISPECIES: hypothetical protein [Rhodococcus]|uniref:Uncharacterized protein n=1 Tax=Rhodococcus aetherivorans TaxID=191292 RepID=A0A059MRH1_9NOCA|nr:MULTISPECIES: hypothetical protein [Rhodococcus]ETT26700.1 hypothetical protein RR21198_2605 [Rhodococcus rhodochrous ATCC 21198]AKE89639.1 hypothetical protein AAT18_10835 [Rhodococcus aetherivorans]ANZ25650.1 hypothetical protein A4U64_13905 [Rhodococcus sp. WB1]KDE13728.1 hypothetical protein N505_0107825 [Rhodococcus aetherivorans]MBC2587073.1 hypothetical protein [Rhodococcus aetherivorans]